MIASLHRQQERALTAALYGDPIHIDRNGLIWPERFPTFERSPTLSFVEVLRHLRTSS